MPDILFFWSAGDTVTANKAAIATKATACALLAALIWCWTLVLGPLLLLPICNISANRRRKLQVYTVDWRPAAESRYKYQYKYIMFGTKRLPRWKRTLSLPYFFFIISTSISKPLSTRFDTFQLLGQKKYFSTQSLKH